MEFEELALELVEQEGEKRYTKPFPHVAYRQPGQSLSRHFSWGSPWRIHIHAEDAPIPEEVFVALDLHSQAKERPGYIGWIGGTETVGGADREGSATGGVIFVTEAQSDLLQQTSQFMTKDAYQRLYRKRMSTTASEYGALTQELEQLYAKYGKKPEQQIRTSPLGKEALKAQLAGQQRIRELEFEIAKLYKKRWKGGDPGGEEVSPEYPKFAEFRNKVENYYKRWLFAFYNATIDYARERNAKYLFIATADLVFKKWPEWAKTDAMALFKRVYDYIAQRLNMRHLSPKEIEYAKKMFGKDVSRKEGDVDISNWWIGQVDALPRLESLSRTVDTLLNEDIEPSGQWKSHLDAFVKTFSQQQGLDPVSPFDFKEIFDFWLDNVQDELKSDRNFRTMVNAYTLQKWSQDTSDMWAGFTLIPEPEGEPETFVDELPTAIDWSAFERDVDRAYREFEGE